MSDPIIDHFAIWFRRTLLFIVVALLQAIALSLWVLLVEIHVTNNDLQFWLRAAWSPTIDNKLPAVILYGSLAIGILTTTVFYLLVSKWWKKRGDVHRRGARFGEGEM
ncbi:hypothetical protein AAKU61_002572 [Undibacterium sp. GrIS 1.2]|uniref:hypothetical protein n=1 Tax=Undibacterium sp. GrIS 1.2 TaxID=3143933 RepID=UPI0033992421